MARITRATFKSFLRKHFEEGVYVKVLSHFDGCTDGVEDVRDEFRKICVIDFEKRNTFGVSGIWLVDGPRGDYFETYNRDGFRGIRCDNCCGAFVVAVKAGVSPINF